jgi:hypothetical protein
MKEYLKPYIEEEEVEIEDICSMSLLSKPGNVDADDVEEVDVTDVFNF